MHRSAPAGRQGRSRGVVAATLASFLLLALACLFLPVAVDAQEAEPAPVRVTLHGVVYDALNGTAVPGAAVYLERESRGALADSLGTFRFDDVAVGSQLVAAIQFGYEETAAPVEVPADGAFVEIELTPQPILLDGVTAVVENISTMERRMRTRRRSVPYQARAFDQERLLRSASSNILDFLSQETLYSPVQCPAGSGFAGAGNPAQSLGWNRPSRVPAPVSSYCIIRRGRMVSPKVYIDEIPVIGGLDVLESYPTAQIYALEVYSQGTEIRAYTYGFMQRMAERPMALIPISLWP